MRKIVVLFLIVGVCSSCYSILGIRAYGVTDEAKSWMKVAIQKSLNSRKLDGYFVSGSELNGFGRMMFYRNGLVSSSFMSLPDCSDSTFTKFTKLTCRGDSINNHFYNGAAWGIYWIENDSLFKVSIFPMGTLASSKSLSIYEMRGGDSLVFNSFSIIEPYGLRPRTLVNSIFVKQKQYEAPNPAHAWLVKQRWFRKMTKKSGMKLN